jgi:Ca2+-binding RTX toxin-like protein
MLKDPEFWDLVEQHAEDLFKPLLDPLTELGHWLGQNLPTPYDIQQWVNDIQQQVNDLFNAARGWVQPYYDPLALDLDGDGIETVGVAGSGTVLFDHDGDGLKQGTGWVKSDDGLLVLDRNGNGVIDNGAELFGVDTVLSDGQKATDGFAALRDLDANADGVFDAADGQFANVRVWRDLNQDGVSQAGELKNLAELGIASISLNATSTNTNLGNGNTVTHSASFTRADGSTGTAGNLNFAQNAFYREFTDSVQITDATRSLPDMAGSGLVRDLREAASLSSEVAATLSAMTTDTTRAQFIAHANTLIDQWAATSTLQNSYDLATQQNLDLTFLPPGVTAEEAYFVLHEDDFGGLDTGTPTLVISDERKAEIRAQIAEIEHLIKVLEPFNGQNFLQFTDGQATDTTVGVVAWIDGGSGGSSIGWAPVPGGRTPVFGRFEQGRLDLLRQSYEALKQSVYQGLALQTWLKPYLDAASFTVTETGLALDFSALNARLDTLYQTDAGNALTDLIELNRYAGDGLRNSGWTGLETLRTWVEGAVGNAGLEAILQDLHVARGSGNFAGTATGDILFGASGNDTVKGEAGDDTLDGGAGNDTLYGGAGADTLLGGDGNDYLYGDAGDDVLEGGAGTDYLSGGLGSDTYRFGLGDGQDTIASINDTTTGKLDVLQFKDGVAASDVRLSTSGDSLVIKLAGTTDQITVQNFLYQDDPSNAYNPLQQITFADGTTWGLADIQAKLYAGTDNAETLSGTVNADTIAGQGGADYLYGKAGDDTLDGGAGNDTLYGGAGADTLLGGAGNDYLYGDAGDDVLEGGAGTDYLSGGLGNDTYRFGLGDGQDTISDYESSANTDQLLFGADIAIDQLWFRHVGSNLEVSVIGTDDKATISNWYSGAAYHIEQFQTADGRTLLDSQVENLVTAMAAFAPPSAGQTTLPQNYQDALNSVIAANWQ